ncbi:MAG: PKD domain-containing protein [Methanomicrobiales archaeon]|nr:PKD domain-containing protein [Methanomicrobiales archaeon]
MDPVDPSPSQTPTAPPIPMAAFSINASSGPAPLVVRFTDASEGDNLTYHWDFGDAGTSVTESPVHGYAAEGDYTAELTVSNTGGANTSHVHIQVLAPRTTGTITAGFFANRTAGKVPLPVQFSDASTVDNPASYWDFGDGATSTEQNTVHVYRESGTFTVCHRITVGGDSVWLNRSAYIAVAGDEIVANFTADPVSGLPPLSVQFTDISRGTNLTYFWDFGDGNISYHQDPLHTYDTLGSYTVSHRVVGTEGLDWENQTDLIVVSDTETEAVFIANPAYGFAPLNVQFTDLSEVPDARSWLWDFGDGTSSTLQNPSHTYVEAGYYSVTLTIKTSNGENSVTRWNEINALANWWNGPVEGDRSFLEWTPSAMPEGWAFDYEIPTGNFPSDIPTELPAAKTVSNTVSTTGIQFTMGVDGRREARIDRAMVQDTGGVVMVEESGIFFTYPGFGIWMTAESPSVENDIISAVPQGYRIIGDPLAADLSLGRVNTSYEAVLADLPEQLGMDATIKEGVDTASLGKFNMALRNQALEVKDVAFVVHYTKTNMTLRDASVTMEIPSAWVQTHGGEGLIRMIRISDEGDVQVLGTQVIPYGEALRFTGTSPKGLSHFGLVAVGELSTVPSSHRASPDTTASDAASGEYAPDSYSAAGTRPAVPSAQFIPSLPEFGMPDISGFIKDFLNSFLHIGVILVGAVAVLLFIRRIRKKGSDDILLNWHSEFKDDGTRPKKL